MEVLHSTTRIAFCGIDHTGVGCNWHDGSSGGLGCLFYPTSLPKAEEGASNWVGAYSCAYNLRAPPP